ncbi:phosphotransferase family protein [Mycobacterium vicinigordonae]|uniref:Phosphotransferase family protein n=1 Tax=Mycobacterium vicinigordonae TaxID=1719132 RepID=A0A7D6I145_9MYCO|nr:phosphotransferase family protein [Mycobacterium vicinigordonae]QLL07634.1 phosphotransferase family protein [Mycobacterium vicinigordonae]
MAGLSLVQRDLAAAQEQLSRWFAAKFGSAVSLTDLSVANKAGGFSSESLLASVVDAGRPRDYVVRIPPAGGGIFPDYDLEAQTRTQELLRSHGVATPSPLIYEPDPAWIGSKFLLMSRIAGHIPGDMSYARKGWLHDAPPNIQRCAQDSFLTTLAYLQCISSSEAPWLRRPTGVGNEAELAWWREFVKWGTDNHVPDLMLAAFDWLWRNLPADPAEPGVSWGDARMSNAIFDDSGNIVGALDWEQACLCAAEADFGWWLAARRQMRSVFGIQSDPELPGFDSRERVIGRYEDMIGRRLRRLEWYEHFASVRLGCCTLRIQVLLRATGRGDHFLARAPLLPDWTIEAIRA